ncbi:MAG: hypothetical protein LC798_13780 [Chloroflexi bacterium]|nr:hypothetical protein [Chloroflexota bacterium]
MNVYTARMAATALTAAKDLISIDAPATASMVVLRAAISQSGSETSDQVSALIRRATGAVGAGTVHTPRAHSPQAPAFPGTALVNLTTDETAGDELYGEGFNLLNGFLWVPVPEERIVVPPSGIVVLRLHLAPAASTNIVASLTVGFN